MLKVKRLSSDQVKEIVSKENSVVKKGGNGQTERANLSSVFDSQLCDLQSSNRDSPDHLQVKAHLSASDQSSLFSRSSFEYNRQSIAVHRARDDSVLELFSGDSFQTSPLPAAQDALFALGFVSPASTPPQGSAGQGEASLDKDSLEQQGNERDVHSDCKDSTSIQQDSQSGKPSLHGNGCHGTEGTPLHQEPVIEGSSCAEAQSASMKEASNCELPGDIKEMIVNTMQPDNLGFSVAAVNSESGSANDTDEPSYDQVESYGPNASRALDLTPFCSPLGSTTHPSQVLPSAGTPGAQTM